MSSKPLPLSVLNLAPRFEGESPRAAIDRVVDLARAAEAMGYRRYWIAEHHNFAGVMSSATDLIIQHVLSHTESIVVGAGGIMLPNHVPLQVAEAFGTLATLYPDRVDLGLGRAPGTDRETMRVLNTGSSHSSQTFPDDVALLRQYFGPEEVQGKVRAYPGLGTEVPLYILGSSYVSAHIAADLGLPYVFAAHFSDHDVGEALRIYRQEFKASTSLSEPYAMVCVMSVVAETEDQAQYWYSSAQQMYLNNFAPGGQAKLLSKPDKDFKDRLSSAQKILLEATTGVTFLGDKDQVRQQWLDFQSQHQVDELMTVSYIHDTEALVTSYQLFYDAIQGQ